MLDAECKCLQPLDEDEAICWAQAAPQVTQPFDTSTDDERSRPEGLAIAQAVVAWAGLSEVGELTIGPVKLTRVDDRTTHRCTIPTEVLRQRIDHDVSTMLNRTAEHRRQRIVYDQGEGVCVCHVRHRCDVHEVELRIA